MTIKKPTALIILDGFGYKNDKDFNAVAQSYKPHFDFLLKHFPHTLLKASGTWVGLPENFIGNSEVGHLTIGAGRILEQPISIIRTAISNNSFFTNPLLIKKFSELKNKQKKLHIMGLLSDAGVHSHVELLYALIKMAAQEQIANVIIHPFLDGRDVCQQSASQYLSALEQIMRTFKCGSIGTIHGRFYAMDRDKNWERTQKSYNVLTEKQKIITNSWQEVLDINYEQGIFDEFIPPTQLDANAIIEEGDGIIFFNIRPDRTRQLTQAFTDKKFNKFPTHHFNLAFFITPVSYGSTFNTTVLFEQSIIHNTLKEILSKNDKTILSIAETEKYAHITYFFAGGQEHVFDHEFRILIPSINAQTYAQFPEMSAQLITQSVLKSLKKSPKDFYLINYCNADMVGHSGDFKATIKAIEFLDKQLEALYQKIVLEMHGTIYITADHGKAEEMFDKKTGLARTAHTTNLVPFLMLRHDLKGSNMKLPINQLSDIAPFILKEMGIEPPIDMKR